MLVEPLPRDKPEVAKEKGAILMKLIEIFGEDKKSEMVKLIDNNFAQGKEKIVDLWINKICSQ